MRFVLIWYFDYTTYHPTGQGRFANINARRQVRTTGISLSEPGTRIKLCRRR